MTFSGRAVAIVASLYRTKAVAKPSLPLPESVRSLPWLSYISIGSCVALRCVAWVNFELPPHSLLPHPPIHLLKLPRRKEESTPPLLQSGCGRLRLLILAPLKSPANSTSGWQAVAAHRPVAFTKVSYHHQASSYDQPDARAAAIRDRSRPASSANPK